MNTTALMTFGIGLLAITNPLGNAALYLGLVGDRQRSEQKKISFKCALGAAIIFVLVVWTGKDILTAFGISIGSFQLAGGIVLTILGLSMVRGGHFSEDNGSPTTDKLSKLQNRAKVAIVPLATPIIAGPGSITTIVTHAKALHTTVDKIAQSGICLLLAFLTWLVFYFAPTIVRVIGNEGIGIV